LLLISSTPGKPGGAIGVVTLEGKLFAWRRIIMSIPTFLSLLVRLLDIIEVCLNGGLFCEFSYNNSMQEILSEEIVDETDRYQDNQSKKRAQRATTAAVMRG
jgi:hypothetical protein